MGQRVEVVGYLGDSGGRYISGTDSDTHTSEADGHDYWRAIQVITEATFEAISASSDIKQLSDLLNTAIPGNTIIPGRFTSVKMTTGNTGIVLLLR